MNQYTSYLSKHPKLLASTLLISSPIAYLVYLHRSLSKTTHHAKKHGLLTSSIADSISSIPASAFSSEHVMAHDRAYKSVPASLLPALGQQELITLYLRHTMGLFSSRFPQAYLLRLVSKPEDRKTFEQGYISTLDFKEGDLVCGLYRVAVRTESKVEFEMTTVGIMQGGRLVIGIEGRGDEWVCSSETVMWKRAEEKGLMPLERGVARWMHELAAWWLLDSGTRFLVMLKKGC